MRHLFLMGGKGAGLMKMSEKAAVGSGNLTSSLVSNPLTQSLEQVSYFWKICRLNLSSEIHENDNDVTKINTRKYISPMNKNRGQRNVTVK